MNNKPINNELYPGSSRKKNKYPDPSFEPIGFAIKAQEDNPMLTLDIIRKKLRKDMKHLSERYKVSSLQVFGSFSRGEQTEHSDIDILVEFSQTIDLFDYVELQMYLGELLGAKVDLVTGQTLKPQIKDKVLREAVAI